MKGFIKMNRTGTSIIPLIDGDRFIDLVAEYELFVEPVTIYKLGGFFDGPS